MHGYKWPINCTRTRSARETCLRHDTCDDLRFLHAAQILAMQRLPVAALDQRGGHVLLPDVLQLARVLRKQRLVSQDTACRLSSSVHWLVRTPPAA